MKFIKYMSAAVIAAVIAVLSVFTLPIYTAAYADGDGAAKTELKVHFVDVGQGDCTIIELPDGKNMIIDGGERFNDITKGILDFISATLPDDFTYFDYCILTHPDSDHCGSLDDVLEKYPSRFCYRPNVEANYKGFVDPGKADLTAGAAAKASASYNNAIEAMYKASTDFTPTVYVTSAETPSITGGEGDDEYSFTFFSPLSDVYSDVNDYSPIMLLEYRGYKFAMSGDAEKDNEREFAEKVESAATDGVTDKYDIFTDEFCVNVLKAGHHGSYTSSSQAYLDVMTTPEGAKSVCYIFSCGKDNKYDHPHDKTLKRLSDMGVPESNMMRTDKLGSITFNVKPDETGAYGLFNASGKVTDPEKPTSTKPEEKPDEDPPYLKWVIIAAIVVAVIIVAVLIYRHSKSNGRGGSSSDGRSENSRSRGRRGGGRH